MKSNELHVDRPPRSLVLTPSTRNWAVRRVDAETTIWFTRNTQDEPAITVARALSDEEIDTLHLAYEQGWRSFSKLEALLSEAKRPNSALRNARLDYYREHAPLEWKQKVGLTT